MKQWLFGGVALLGCLAASERSALAQLSASSYRALGQTDLRRNGVNLVQGLEMHNPSAVALDGRGGMIHLYVSDTRNHRVLAWQDARSYQIGDPPTLILGQPNPQSSSPLGIGPKGFNSPAGLAVDPASGNLYVADTGNNRVLRFPYPFASPSRIEPDTVYGQPSFNITTAGASRTSMNQPRAAAFDNVRNLWVADTSNHRVLRFSAALLDGANPEADLVLGQGDFNGNAANRGAGVNAKGFDLPAGLAIDAQGNLYVSDFNNARVLRFAPPVGADSNPAAVFGQPDFTTKNALTQASAQTMVGPVGLAVDSATGNLYVAIPRDNRILVFAANGASGASAKDLLGQVDFSGIQANPSSFPHASSSTFAAVGDIKLDPDGNLFVADTGNNRVLSFPRGGKAATRVWGQVDFRSNGANRVKPGSLNTPFKIVIDYSRAPFPLYVSDTENHRILIWRDAVRFRTGDPANLVIGQPDLETAAPNVDTRSSAIPSHTSLAFPKGIALDAAGNLYVADSGNHRVLRYPRPVDQIGRIGPDLVIGQANFVSSVSAAVTMSSLNSPSGVAIDPDGNIFVADSGNHRVLQYPRDPGNNPPAIRVFGQPGFNTGLASGTPSVQTLSSPQGIAIDGGATLYIADAGNNRVLIFPNTRDAAQAGAAAAIVLGQDRFDSRVTGGGANGLRSPFDVAVDSRGGIHVVDSGNHRLVTYPPLLFLPLSGGQATAVVGQSNLSGGAPNWNAAQSGHTTPEGLASPLGLFLDRLDTLYVSDTGNNRVLHFLKPAAVVHAANLQPGAALARGGLAVFQGAELAPNEEKASNSPLPAVLAGREVVFNDDFKAPLLTVSPTRIEFQTPGAAPLGSARVAVRIAETGELLAGAAVPVASTSAGLFTNQEAGQGPGRILNQDGAANGASTPAARGSIVKILGTGQGPVSPSVPDGEMAGEDVLTVAVPTSDGATCLTRQPSVCVAIGNTFGEVEFSGLASQMIGVWELRVRIPETALTGNVPLRAVINGSPSNVVTLAIR